MANQSIASGIEVIEVRTPAWIEALIDLRHRMLREGLPRDSARFKGDSDPTTRHFAAVLLDQEDDPKRGMACCATFCLGKLDEEPAWQLRGMATDAGHQGKGFGREVLERAEVALTIRPENPRVMWCNARLAAVGFYERMGWICISGTFDLAGVGPHRKMMKRLPR